MENFWDNRYKAGGNSGSGSYGENAKHKADVINQYISKYGIKTISDFGCGDGNQISLFAGFEKYVGFDVSPFIIDKCRKMFSGNMSFVNKVEELPNSEMCLSLDVIYHILNPDDYVGYMKNLFGKSSRFVLIFSSNHDNNNHDAIHIHHRKFTDWVDENRKDFKLVEEVDNFLLTSAKFFLFEKI